MKYFEYIDTSAFSIKARSKREMYDLLTSKGGIYLPKLQDSHYKLIRELAYRKEESKITPYHVSFSSFYAKTLKLLKCQTSKTSQWSILWSLQKEIQKSRSISQSTITDNNLNSEWYWNIGKQHTTINNHIDSEQFTRR